MSKRRRLRKPTVYVRWPREVLLDPPVRHRGNQPEAGLTVFEVAVAGGILLLAGEVLSAERHKASMRAGRREMRRARREWVHSPEQMRSVGGSHYELGGIKFDDTIDERVFSVETTRAAVMRAAGLGRCGQSVAALRSALRRLQRSIRRMPPLLTELRIGRKLHLSVDSRWLPRRKYRRVPWPPPTRGGGTAVLAMYLLVQALDYRADTSTTMDADKFIERVGLSARWPEEHFRGLSAALRAVNAHLRALRAPVEFDFELSDADDGARIKLIARDLDQRRAAILDSAPTEEEQADEREREHWRIKTERSARADEEHRALMKKLTGG
jgi:hypothetical protein